MMTTTTAAGLPDILAGADLKAVVGALRAARGAGAGVIWGLGAHVIKTGLSPVLIDLMERGYVSALAMNGAGIIHDFELALYARLYSPTRQVRKLPQDRATLYSLYGAVCLSCATQTAQRSRSGKRSGSTRWAPMPCLSWARS